MDKSSQINIALTSHAPKQDLKESKLTKLNSLIEDDKPEAPPSRTSKLWYLLFPILFVIWPIGRLIYANKVSFNAIMAFHSMVIWACIYANIFPAAFCIYFFIIYTGTVYMEFDLFLHLPNEGFHQTIKNTIDFSEGLIPLQVMIDTFGKHYTLKFVLAILTPVVIIGLIIFSDGQEFALIFGASLSLFLVAAFKSYQIGALYRTISYDLKEVGEVLDEFIADYDCEKMYQTSIYLKKTTERWSYNMKVFMIVDYSQVLSLFIISGLCFAYFFNPGVVSSLFVTDSPVIDTNEGYRIFVLLIVLIYALYGIRLLIWKLLTCYSITSRSEDVESKFEDIYKQLSYIIQVPHSFLKIAKEGQFYNPTPNDIIAWTDISFNERNFRRLFDEDESFIMPLVKSIEMDEGVQEVSFKQLKRLISESAEKSIKSFDLIKKDYDNLYEIVEYKFFGVFAINKQFINKTFATMGTAVIGFLFTQSDKIFGWNMSKLFGGGGDDDGGDGGDD